MTCLLAQSLDHPLLTIMVDQRLRAYATRLHSDGEDAYQQAVCEVMARNQMDQIRDIYAFFRVATKRALYQFFRHERAEREQTAAWLRGDPPSMCVGLAQGRLTHSHCRKGHPMSDDNLAYIGPRRTCRTCKRTREAVAARTTRQMRKCQNE